MTLNKRIFRDIKQNFARWFSLFVLVALGMYMVVSLIASAETIIDNVNNFCEENNVEDGEFTLFTPLTDEEKNDLEDNKYSIEESFYIDFKQDDNSTIRIFKNRDNINVESATEGTIANNDNQVMLEKHYAEKHDLKVGDKITIADKEFTIVGIGISPDYDNCKQNIADVGTDAKTFGTAFVTDDEYDNLKETGKYEKTEVYEYSYTLEKGAKSSELKKTLKALKVDENILKAANISGDVDNLTMFLEGKDNPRIKASVNEVATNKSSGITGGIIVLILFTYVISVFIIHELNEESSAIGALYSMGVKKSTLLWHYIKLPVIISFLGGLVGTLIALTKAGIGVMIASKISYYSLPTLEYSHPAYVLIYGIVAPPVIAFIVNMLVINKKLSQTPLSLLRNSNNAKVHLFRLHLPKKMSFNSQFRIRQFLREMRASIALCLGMLISLLFLMLSLMCFCGLDNFKDQNKKDLNYKYMYSLKYELDEVPSDATESYAKTLSKTTLGYDMDVTIVGTNDNNNYFKFNPPKNENKIILGTSAAKKFGVKAGDKITLRDKVNDKDYTFTIDKVVQYSIGLYAFMDIDEMRSLFGEDEDYYNILISDNKLDIDTDAIYSVTTDKDVLKFATTFQNNMNSMIYMMLFASIIIFVVVMYLMIKIMIDRSANNISLMKIFGYTNSEVRKLYIDGNFITIVISSIICVPLAKVIMTGVWPSMVASVQCGFDVSFKAIVYVLIYALIFVCYFVVVFILNRKLNKISATEVLKNRE